MAKDFNELIELVNQQISGFPKKYQHVMVFVSGGVDSIVLFRVFCEIFKQKNFSKFSLFHVNYRLRGQDSENDFAFCRDLACSEGAQFLSYIVSDQELKDLKSNLQEKARDIRYKAARAYIDDKTLVVTAHHRSDLAENILYRMTRGCGMSGMLGMSSLNDNLFRPFLSVDKENLIQIANSKGFAYREDQSNNGLKYSRNRIRHLVLPELEKLHEGACEKLVDTARDIQEFYDYTMNSLYPKVYRDNGLSLEALKALPPAIARSVLHFYINQTSKSDTGELDRHKLRSIYSKIISEDDFIWQLNLVESLEKKEDFISLVDNLKEACSLFNGLEAILDSGSEAEICHSDGMISVSNEHEQASVLKLRSARLKEKLKIGEKNQLVKEVRRVNFPDSDPKSIIVMEELNSKKNQLLSLKNGRIERLTSSEPTRLKINFSVTQ